MHLETGKSIQNPPACADSVETLRKTVAANIAALRQAQKMTQLEVGNALNYSDKAISKWERGDAVPDAYVLLQMSRLFGVSVDYQLLSHEAHRCRVYAVDLLDSVLHLCSTVGALKILQFEYLAHGYFLS